MLRPSDALIEALLLLWLGYSINPIPFPSCQFNNRFLVFENFLIWTIARSMPMAYRVVILSPSKWYYRLWLTWQTYLARWIGMPVLFKLLYWDLLRHNPDLSIVDPGRGFLEHLSTVLVRRTCLLLWNGKTFQTIYEKFRTKVAKIFIQLTYWDSASKHGICLSLVVTSLL